MSTHAAIIRKVAENQYEGIYCHYDGYEEGVGACLREHYQAEAKVAALIALGAISSLEPELEQTDAYHRDRGEDLIIHTSESAQSVSRSIDADFAYLYADGKWQTLARP